MAKGRQTKTVARISVTGAVIDIHGKKFINWSVTRPLDPKAEKLVMHTTYNGDMQAAVTEMGTWLDANFKGVS